MCYVWKIHSSTNSEATTLQPVTSFAAHPGKYITRCVLSPDTKLARILIANGSTDPRHLATCSADSTVRIWSTVNFEYTPEKTLTGHQRWVWDAAFSADSAYLVTGKFRTCLALITASSDHSSRLWDLTSGETVRQYAGHHR